MSLFNSNDSSRNLLPKDGAVYYYGAIFNTVEIKNYYQRLLSEIEWQNDEVMMFGKRIITKRKTAWYGEKEYVYTYSKIQRKAILFNELLIEIKKNIEQLTNEKFNSCLLNLYHNGGEGMSWHSDDEKEIIKNSAIASISFGAERKFQFKHKQTGEIINIFLENGSLMIMAGECQQCWLHQLPVTKKINEPRINLTFRLYNQK